MAQNRIFSLGGIGGGPNPCCCGGGECTASVCLNICGVGIASGIPVRLKFGGSTVASGTTDGTGCASMTIPGENTYTVEFDYNGQTISVDDVLVGCGDPTILPFGALQVIGCVEFLTDATVTIDGHGTQTTDSTGNTYWYLPFSGYTYTVSHFRFADATGTWDGTTCLQIPMEPADGYTCACGCNIPVCNTLNFTDSLFGASISLVHAADPSNPLLWYGTYDATYTSIAGCCPGGTVRIYYWWPGGTTGGPPDCISGAPVRRSFGTESVECPAHPDQLIVCPGTGPPGSGGPGLGDPDTYDVVCYPLDAVYTYEDYAPSDPPVCFGCGCVVDLVHFAPTSCLNVLFPGGGGGQVVTLTDTCSP